MRKLIFLFIAASFLFSCSNENGNDRSDSVKSDSLKLVPTVSEWHSLTDSWTASLNLKNASIMKSFYADSVIYYGDKISGEDVVKRQQEYFSSNKDYHQKLAEYISEEQQPDGTWRIRITKQVTAAGKTADYPASLVFIKQNGIWKIASESDDITDLKKGRPLSVHYEPEVITVEGLLEENTAFSSNTIGGDPKRDNKVMYFSLWPSQPLNVIAIKNDEINITETGIDHIQLNGDENQLRSLLNKKVKISGTLFHSHTSYHYTTVLMNVNSVTAIN
ncbi:MAG: DUF4431 domain-containing protein [Bacteroidota bacterium]|nr:DUF4431 domain-containing protein [Bacteroidota bacterium]